ERATSMSAVTCEERATSPDGPRRSRPPGCAALFASPALLVGYRPLRVSFLLAPWRDEKSAATRQGRVFQQAPGCSAISPATPRQTAEQAGRPVSIRSEEHTSELQSLRHL